MQRAYLLLIVVAAIAFGVLSFLTLHAYNQVKAETKARIAALQAERLASCRDGQARHIQVIRVFDHDITLALQAATTSAERRHIEQQKNATLALIDALVPSKNCVQTIFHP